MELADILGGAPAPVETPQASTVETAPEPVVAHDATPEPVQAEPTTTVEQQAAEQRARDERGRFTRQEPVVEEKPHTVPVQALLEERRKRQELEQRLSQQQAPQLKDDDFWQSPVQATQQMLAAQTQGMQQEIANLKYQLAEDLTRTMHADYDSVRDSFIAKVHTGDPWAVAIAQQMSMQPNPAKFVYDQAQRIAQVEKVGDLQGFENRIRAEERARVLKELQAQPRVQAPDVPRSLNAEPSAVIGSGETYEKTPLSNLFDRPF